MTSGAFVLRATHLPYWLTSQTNLAKHALGHKGIFHNGIVFNNTICPPYKKSTWTYKEQKNYYCFICFVTDACESLTALFDKSKLLKRLLGLD